MSLFEILEALHRAGLRAEYKALRDYIDERDEMLERLEQCERGHDLPFTVLAGKFDGGERNIKYSESFATLDEALTAYDRVADYPWHEIEYKGTGLYAVHCNP